ncbi:MAG TPA: HAMP domain-containing histidine kinase [Candidatus Alectryocaccomicrobium excrementavium]|uniref:histidine kinase n=1 Tax=Candidatus Alectryocaccomicrobium excrementavium TaxID=2840668 RepID=A0A9D1FZR0_9FIRM|nr:HAMP domain-containing histidine kinase [Candidatus Alectryocaccomicrobium excrementavium]
MTGALIALSLALAACLWAHLRARRRLRALARQIEETLRTGQPIPVSVRDDALSQLENAVSELSARLYQSQENARAEARKTEKLIVDLSHQLKTPLAALRLYTEMDEPAHAARTLGAIERMERLAYSLLRLERLRAGAYPFAFQMHSLAAIARESIAEMSALFPGRAFALEGDARVRCDAQWLGEAIGNLLKNACEHTPGGGRIRVYIEQAESTARISVEDEGGGVPPGEEERLFERFYRRGGADAPGAGVGLNIVRAIAEQHHGAAWAENAQKGLRVTISLPLLPLLKESIGKE